MLTLGTPLSRIAFITPRFLKSLEKLGLRTVQDLIWHFPSRYEDFSQIYNIGDLEPGQHATICGLIKDVELRRSFRRRMAIVEAVIEDETGSIKAVWFNQPYLKNTLKVGRMMNFSGKVGISESEIYLPHPDYELTTSSERQETKHTGRLVPIYPETRGLTSRALRFIVQPILKNLETLREFLPREILASMNFPEINEAIQNIHFPLNVEEVEQIKKRFAFQDLFLLQLFNLEQKLRLAREKAPQIKTDIEYVREILGVLPFELTTSQKKSLWEIIQDLEKDHPMNRLLQGDVGSGKTVIAALSALIAARNGFQAAFMAPTEVLVNQHFKTMKELFLGIAKKKPESYLPPLGLLTASGAKIFFPELNSESGPKKLEIQKKILSGEVKIMIGTHALIQKTVKFNNLGLVIIDEQHRFGVRQRAELVGHEARSMKHETRDINPHLLSMSATPIPRTLMLTVFGDLDISVIDELPAGRKNIVTKVVAPENRNQAYGFIKAQVLSGRQAFVICPRIEKSEMRQETWKDINMAEVKSVKEEYEKLSQKIFPDLKVEMLHGQMKAKEKEKIMNEFRDGKIQILVSTSVVEVGVDVPNASIMMIEGSDRFGLAQLYQFRGRVGRGEHQSFCFLFTDSEGETTRKRLEAIVKAKSGFELAEVDLKIRGPGEFLGQSQTGLPDLAMRGLQDLNLIKASREAAVKVLKTDPALKKYRALKERLDEFSRKIHQE
ncbi:MAG: ATP-dependent DNA helicase RecG [Candidatus Liptonbacteria bacterium]|nr:ATP-dependent DNA helicase RecG [Candidatus Liptonbacteria bacterium]